MNSKLSKRLHSLISMIQPPGQGSTLWDIGCDHGQLGLAAPFFHREIEQVNLVDPSELVIDQLKKAIEAHIPKPLFKISIEKKNGENLSINTSKNIFIIAGMGGKTIREILECLAPQAREDDQFLISPNRDILKMREFLLKGTWYLLEERLVEENNQFYQQLSLRRGPGPRKVSLYGEDFWQNGVGERYRTRLLRDLQTHQDPASLEYLGFLRSLSP